MGRILSDPKNEYIFSKILTPVQRERLDLIYSSAKEIGANHFLIDNYIAKYKKDSLILDFEGSMIPTLARFYASFGAEKKYYFLINKR